MLAMSTNFQRRRGSRRSLALLAGCLLSVLARASIAQPLASWDDGSAKQAIVKFVTDVSTEGAPTFLAPSDRIAVFDNDGTLWSEQPLYFQFMFVLDRIKAMAPQHPEWKEREPFKSILAGDIKTALAGGEKAVAEMVAVTHAGMTTDGFEAQVVDWLATARHPRFNRPYTDLVFHRTWMEYGTDAVVWMGEPNPRGGSRQYGPVDRRLQSTPRRALA